jgi:hypothetical protein
MYRIIERLKALTEVGFTRPTPAATRNRRKPAFEQLEARSVPSVTQFTLEPASDTGVKGDSVTSMTDVTVTGTAAANDFVDIVDDTGTTVAFVFSDNDGKFSAELTLPFFDGEYTFSAADGSDFFGKDLTITLDNTDPGAPFNILVVNDNTASPRVTGQLEAADAGAAVQLIEVGRGVVGSGVADINGDFVITTSGLSAGQHVLVAQAVDKAGNASVTSENVLVTIPRTTTTTTTTTGSSTTSNRFAVLSRHLNELDDVRARHQKQLRNARRRHASPSALQRLKKRQANEVRLLQERQAVELNALPRS